MKVTLREITKETVVKIIKLSVSPEQQKFVAPNAVSLAQALFYKDAWYRAIYVDDSPAGFVMLSEESKLEPPPADPQMYLWRFMIDASFQGKGVGKAALQQIIDWIRNQTPFSVLRTSYVPGEGCPEPFYRKLGFEPTGAMDEDEVVLELKIKKNP